MKHYIIGLTGNIGCGKSTVARMLAELGAEIIDFDKLTHQLMEPGTECWRAIVEQFGPTILRPNGTIDRKRLGETVFRDPEAMSRLEGILHPAIRLAAEERIDASPKRVVVLEAIKLIEGGWHRRVDSVWVVVCRRDQQIKRLMRTRGFSLAEAELRVDAQSPPSEKLKHADVVIDNSGTPDETRRQVEVAWAEQVESP
jgi:dephospho-CoA kinase